MNHNGHERCDLSNPLYQLSLPTERSQLALEDLPCCQK